MKSHGISVFPTLFKKSDLAKVFPDTKVKELKKSTNIDIEKDSYSDIRHVVTTMEHSHMNAATPLEVDSHTHHEHQKKKSQKESEEYGDKSD